MTEGEAGLARLDAVLAADPNDLQARYARAGLLAAAGRLDEARAEYLDLLGRSPDHDGALNDLGTLLYRMGYRGASRTVYERAVALRPRQSISRINLANLLLGDGEFDLARGHYEAALSIDPESAEAHQGLAKALIELGQADRAGQHLTRGYAGRSLSVAPFRGEGEPIRVLQLVSAYGGNIQTRLLLDERRYQVTTIVTEFHDPGAPLPPHDFVFNAVGDADLCAAGLEAAARLTALTDRPVINRPEAVFHTGRIANALRLGGLPGVIAPRTELLDRSVLAGPDGPRLLQDAGFTFPVLLRAPGFHTGRHFVRVGTPTELGAAAASLPGQEILAIAYLDASGADGLARKYRVMAIDGRLYPLHLAISDHWKVHYFTAGMADQPARLAEEAAFLADMAGVLGDQAMTALGAIVAALGLDYAGIDFAVNNSGEILLFEANANMVVLPADPDPRWDSRRRAAIRVLDAVEAMLNSRVVQARA